MPSSKSPSPAIERITLISLTVLSLALRVFLYSRYRFDSDEPQHLHVAWGWTQGLVQYRDYFDNHAPLFHMLSAPLLSALGERPNIVLYMRAPMLLLWAVVLWCTWIIARRFYGDRVALWSVVMLSLYPSFFLKTLEYRTDNLWNTIWMIALVVLTGGAPTRARLFATGVILGIATCVSLKTPVLVLSLLLAAIGTRFVLREGFRVAHMLKSAAVFTAGFVLAPAAMAAWFQHLGALPNLIYCAVKFNGLVAHTHAHVILLRIAYPFMLAFVLFYGRHLAARNPKTEGFRERVFLAMLLAMFAATLAGLWVLISPRDLLPSMPLMLIIFCNWVFREIEPRPAAMVFASIAAMCVVSIGYDSAWFADATRGDIEMVRQAITLTRPGETLMDLKGETIYRRRPYYFIFEKITRDAVHAGLLPDGVAAAVASAKCHVVMEDGAFFPVRSRVFLRDNFISVGALRASGQWIARDGSFEVAIPGRYMLLTKTGEASGLLDGSPYTGARDLQPGPHRFAPAPKERIAYLWAGAYERGFTPFRPKNVRR